MYYQGIYSYGAAISSAEFCATKLAIFDGVEQLSVMAATALSPMVFKYGGFTGSFVTGIVGNSAALLYLVFFTKGKDLIFLCTSIEAIF